MRPRLAISDPDGPPTNNTGKPGVRKGRLRVAAGLSLIFLIGVLLLPNGYKETTCTDIPGACTTLSIKTVEHWAGKNIAAHRLQTDFLNSSRNNPPPASTVLTTGTRCRVIGHDPDFVNYACTAALTDKNRHGKTTVIKQTVACQFGGLAQPIVARDNCSLGSA